MAVESDRTVIRPRPGRKAAGDGDRTVIRPRPGGSKTPPAADNEATVVRPRRSATRGPLLVKPAPSFGQGSLAEAASTLLSLAVQLRQVQSAVDVNALHRQALEQVEAFQRQASVAKLGADTISSGSYLLCSLIDEVVLNTHWGEHSAWSQKSLLRIFHQETYGGEQVFNLIEEALGAVRKDYEFLEVAYLCLSLGFEGKYRIDPRGRDKLEAIRADIYQVLRSARDRYRQDLSPSVGVADEVRGRLHSFLSVWVTAAVLALTAFGLYTFLLIDLNKDSDRLLADLATLVPAPVPAQLPIGEARPEVARLRELLGSEIERGVLSVEEYPNRVSVVLNAGELFGSGSTALNEAFYPVLDKVGKALEALPGQVIVTGHTDNQAIRTPRYPSNWHLSLARASAVAKYMSRNAELAGRLLPEGRGDTEPVADNATPAGRAKNRRVTLDLALAGS